MPLEDEAGAYLIAARLPGEIVETETPPTDYLLIADDEHRALAERLAADLERRGHRAAVGDTSEADMAQQIVDLRSTGLERCQQAVRWASAFESRHDMPTLWLLTRDVADLWRDASASPASANLSDDAALWGFGRSLPTRPRASRFACSTCPAASWKRTPSRHWETSSSPPMTRPKWSSTPEEPASPPGCVSCPRRAQQRMRQHPRAAP